MSFSASDQQKKDRQPGKTDANMIPDENFAAFRTLRRHQTAPESIAQMWLRIKKWRVAAQAPIASEAAAGNQFGTASSAIRLAHATRRKSCIGRIRSKPLLVRYGTHDRISGPRLPPNSQVTLVESHSSLWARRDRRLRRGNGAGHARPRRRGRFRYGGGIAAL